MPRPEPPYVHDVTTISEIAPGHIFIFAGRLYELTQKPYGPSRKRRLLVRDPEGHGPARAKLFGANEIVQRVWNVPAKPCEDGSYKPFPFAVHYWQRGWPIWRTRGFETLAGSLQAAEAYRSRDERRLAVERSREQAVTRVRRLMRYQRCPNAVLPSFTPEGR